MNRDIKRAAALVILLAVAGAAFGAERIALARYIAGLETIREALAARRLDAAKTEARALRGATVDTGRETFRADDALLTDIVDTKAIDPALHAQVSVTIEELLRASPAGSGGEIDRELLQKLDEERRAHDLEAGGEIAGTELPEDVPFVTRMVRALGRALVWIGERLAELADWLLGFLPRSVAGKEPSGGVRGIVLFVAALIVLILIALALQVLRRGRGAEKVESTAMPSESRDADPLSRGSNEWERYAAQLAEAERWREAIRAWYHAVLVTLYSSGVLHFRKGRTNWEYIASIAPSHAWRGEFIELTRRFEQEWYGSRESSAGACDDGRERALSILDQVRRGVRGAA
jgi:hypothetical protein